MQVIRTLVVTAVLLASVAGANAALVDRGGGMIYDTTRNITWLADMNYAKTSGYDSDGRMTWAAAKQWAAGLVYGVYDDWRLPTLDAVDPTCASQLSLSSFAGCTGGELSHLFVADFGNRSGSVLDSANDTAQQLDNLALFQNVRSDSYWSGTQGYSTGGVKYAVRFQSATGWQSIRDEGNEWFAIAVRDGNVTAAVPEPKSLALALAALAGAGLARRRTHRIALSRLGRPLFRG